MLPSASDFLSAILGTDGARALKKASTRDPALEPLLVPRAVLAWIETRSAYEGVIPGLPDSYLRFQKSGEVISGQISFRDFNYGFESVSPEHLAAAASAAVGVELRNRREIRDLVLVRLGKSIDALVGAQELAKSVLGTSAPPEPQVAPQAPDAPARTPESEDPAKKQQQFKGVPKRKLPRSPKSKLKTPGIQISKSEAETPCFACGGQQFDEQGFRGCVCFRTLQKSVRLTSYGDGYVLDFLPGSDPELVRELRKSFRGQ